MYFADTPPARVLGLGGSAPLPGSTPRHAPHARKTNRRLAKFRIGALGRISHLKRGYALDRSRLKGHAGARTWTAWAILACNLDTLARRPVRGA